MSQNETKIDGLTIILEDNEIEFEKQSAIKLYAKSLFWWLLIVT